MDSLELKRQAWLRSLSPEPRKDSRRVEIEEKLRKDIREKGVLLVSNAFGDQDGCAGYQEETKVDHKGYQQRFYGCSCWFKGHTDPVLIDSIAVTKRHFIGGLKFILKNPLFLLVKKRSILEYLNDIYHADLWYKKLPENELKPVQREVLRVGRNLIHNEVGLDLLYCFVHFFEDFPYCARVQDALSVSNDLKEFIQTLLEREKDLNLIEKWKLLKKASKLLIFAPEVKRFLDRFIKELDKSKIVLDEDDFYFVLNRERYDYYGLSHEERLRMRSIFDEEQENRPIMV